jgi:hypothetical protein
MATVCVIIGGVDVTLSTMVGVTAYVDVTAMTATTSSGTGTITSNITTTIQYQNTDIDIHHREKKRERKNNSPYCVMVLALTPLHSPPRHHTKST